MCNVHLGVICRNIKCTVTFSGFICGSNFVAKRNYGKGTTMIIVREPFIMEVDVPPLHNVKMHVYTNCDVQRDYINDCG